MAMVMTAACGGASFSSSCLSVLVVMEIYGGGAVAGLHRDVLWKMLEECWLSSTLYRPRRGLQ